MNKIPVGATIAHAYRFAFGEFFNILKLLWLPLAVLSVGSILLGSQMDGLSRAIATHDFTAVTTPWPLIVLIYGISVILTFMQLTAIFQFTLMRPEAANRWYYFSVGKPVWRLIGAMLAMLLAMVGILIIYVIAAAVVLFLFRLGLGAAHISDGAIKAILAFDVILAFLAGYCGFIFCALRFGFLLGATTIAEDRIGLFRSWTLSHGNFWRIFLVVLAVLLPFIVVEFSTLYAAGAFPSFPPTGATPGQLRAFQDAMTAKQMAMLAGVRHYWYITYPGFAVFAVLFYGMAVGAQSYAYRTLTGSDAKPSLP
jgi:hypothetical protein